MANLAADADSRTTQEVDDQNDEENDDEGSDSDVHVSSDVRDRETGCASGTQTFGNRIRWRRMSRGRGDGECNANQGSHGVPHTARAPGR